MTQILKFVFAVLSGVFLLFAFLLSLATSSSPRKVSQQPTQLLPTPAPVTIAELPDLDALPLQDNPNIYQYDDKDSVVTMYVTVRTGNPSDNTNYTWAEVNSFNKW